MMQTGKRSSKVLSSFMGESSKSVQGLPPDIGIATNDHLFDTKKHEETKDELKPPENSSMFRARMGSIPEDEDYDINDLSAYQDEMTVRRSPRANMKVSKCKETMRDQIMKADFGSAIEESGLMNNNKVRSYKLNLARQISTIEYEINGTIHLNPRHIQKDNFLTVSKARTKRSRQDSVEDNSGERSVRLPKKKDSLYDFKF